MPRSSDAFSCAGARGGGAQSAGWRARERARDGPAAHAPRASSTATTCRTAAWPAPAPSTSCPCLGGRERASASGRESGHERRGRTHGRQGEEEAHAGRPPAQRPPRTGRAVKEQVRQPVRRNQPRERRDDVALRATEQGAGGSEDNGARAPRTRRQRRTWLTRSPRPSGRYFSTHGSAALVCGGAGRACGRRRGTRGGGGSGKRRRQTHLQTPCVARRAARCRGGCSGTSSCEVHRVFHGELARRCRRAHCARYFCVARSRAPQPRRASATGKAAQQLARWHSRRAGSQPRRHAAGPPRQPAGSSWAACLGAATVAPCRGIPPRGEALFTFLKSKDRGGFESSPSGGREGDFACAGRRAAGSWMRPTQRQVLLPLYEVYTFAGGPLTCSGRRRNKKDEE